ncbi:MAG TPA: oxygenase MpaB family protein [Solirubrobacterales bacterium]|jgi:uncharacterized protein (DUF2236 family)|nr:oxygenase MpaB family protein [Solirubrobacterales bacterium]
MKNSALPPSDYYFPPGKSIARRVHEERVVGVLYGCRALLLGALDPLTYTATMQETRAIDRPFRRLARTGKIQEAVLLGTRAEADKALRAAHHLHQQVEGSLDGPVGGHRAGTPYSAFDQELMLWTLAVIADSARAVYEVMVRPLSASELEQLWEDYLFFGELFGMSRDTMPASYPEFSAWLQERIDSPEFRPTSHGLAVAPAVAFDIPVQALGRLMLHCNNLIVKGTVPEQVREVFGIRWTPAHQAAFRVVSSINRLASRFLPDPSGDVRLKPD